jgi:CRISPR-associated protein Cmr1
VHDKLTLTLELLTPAFVGGAEPRKLDPYMPLRPSSVRGVLRTWFRTAAAALMWPAEDTPGAPERMVSALRELESRVFGDTEKASPIVVLPPRGGVPHRYADHGGCPDQARAPGVRYLGYGLFEDPRRPPEALVTERHRELVLTIGLRRPIQGASELLRATVWLWVNFGGIGARSRRGFGSLFLSDERGGLGCSPELLRTPSNHKGLIDKLIAGLDWVTDVFRREIPRLSTYAMETGRGPHLSIRTLDGIATISALPVDAPTGIEALERAGRLFRDYRSTLQRRRLDMGPLPDYFSVKTGIESRRPPRAVERAAFGLPLRFYFRSLAGAQAQFNPRGHDRLASPLHFRVHRLEDGGHQRHVVALFNLAEGNGASPLLGAQLEQKGSAGPIAPPDGRIIKQFIDWAVQQAARMPETRLGAKR